MCSEKFLSVEKAYLHHKVASLVSSRSNQCSQGKTASGLLHTPKKGAKEMTNCMHIKQTYPKHQFNLQRKCTFKDIMHDVR